MPCLCTQEREQFVGFKLERITYSHAKVIWIGGAQRMRKGVGHGIMHRSVGLGASGDLMTRGHVVYVCWWVLLSAWV